MDSSQYLGQLRQLIAQGSLQKAIKGLQPLLENSPLLSEAMHQSGRFADLAEQIRKGTIQPELATVTRNQIQSGVLDLLTEIERQARAAPIQQELQQAISIIQSKNVVTGSITAGGNVHVGDTITESSTGRRLRFFSYILVPVLAIGLAYLGYRLYVNSQPLNQTILIKHGPLVEALQFEEGTLKLKVGDYQESQTARRGETNTFTAIPAQYRTTLASLSFQAEGFEPVDTLIELERAILELRIKRDASLSKVYGSVQDEDGRAVIGARVSIRQELVTQTDEAGNFEFNIPLELQQKQQRVKVQAEGYKAWDFYSPIFPGNPISVVLQKE